MCSVIDRAVLHDWLIHEIADQPSAIPDHDAGLVAQTVATTYLSLGRHFGLFTHDEDVLICALIDHSRHWEPWPQGS